MRGVTQLRSLGDLRTSISTHGRATPRQVGSLHLELYRLEKEKGRLETEIALLHKRTARVERRSRAVEAAIAALVADSEAEPPRAIPPRTSTGLAEAGSRLRRMTVGY